MRLHDKAQMLIALQRYSHCLSLELYSIRKWIMWAECKSVNLLMHIGQALTTMP